MEKGVIVSIKGKADANAWESWLKSLNDPIIYHLSHLNIGFNPLAKMNDNATEAERVLGAVTFGFGHQPNFLKGNITTGKFHTEAILASPTIYLDGKIVLMDNKLDEKLGFVKMV